jgi:peptidoglycan/xylan/chitin deacetylase (PgdA/CDA1 family)
LLERYGLPATVFVATGYLGGQFWWDELALIAESLKTLPERFGVTINGKVHEWREERTLGHNQTAVKESFLFWLQQVFQCLHQSDWPKAMEQARCLAVGTTTENRPNPMALSPEELLHLASGNLVEIAAHTVSHPILSRLPLSHQKSEIVQSKVYLEELLSRPVVSFSYPHGSLSKATVSAVQDAGYDCACTSLNDIVNASSNPFQLPRFWVRNSDGSSVARWLNRWLNV